MFDTIKRVKWKNITGLILFIVIIFVLISIFSFVSVLVHGDCVERDHTKVCFHVEKSTLKINERTKITTDVTNTGERAAEEIVQLYVGFEGSKVERPVKLLRAFDKVALEPGETKTVPLTVAAKDLAWYNPDAGAWEVEPMAYAILVGPSSRPADLLPATFTVE